VNRKVVVVGLDGGTFDLIGPWAEEGKLPNMAWLMKNGTSGCLTSTFPPVTPTAWASFMTGKNPGKHGVMDFYLRQKDSYNRIIVNASNIDGETLWTILSKAGMRVGVVHVPLTYPPEKVNGFIVSGYALSPSLSTYPPDLARELSSKVYGYKRVYSDILLVQYMQGMEDAYLESVRYATEREVEVTFYLMENYEWDLFMTHFYFLDSVQHFLWKYIDPKHPTYCPEGSKKYGDAILKYYQRMDDVIGEILRRIDPNTTMIILSDHGFGPLYKRVYINHWLKKIGLLRLGGESKSPTSKDWLSKLGLTREKLVPLVEKHDLLKFFMRMAPRVLARKLYWGLPRSTLTLQDVDYQRTQAYSAGYVGQIYINLEGRDPHGIVEPGKDYEELRDYIIKELYELRDPESGEKIVDNVSRKEEIYWGQHIDQAADLLFTMMNMSYITQGTAGSPWEFGPDMNSLTGSPGSLTGWHRLNGIFIATGPDIKKGFRIENARIIDLAPTILHIFDVPISSDVDGRVLKEIFKPDSCLAKNKVRYQVHEVHERGKHRLTEKEEEEIKKKLKALGYMD